MRVIPTSLAGVLILEPKVFGDDRGFFLESFNARDIAGLTGCAKPFVQDNHSRSARNVLRGLHYQSPPLAQDKLVRCTAGEILDIVVDIRRGSATFGRWEGARLSAENKRLLWVPAGFAHGFLTLSDTAEVMYKVTEYYSPSHERSVLWNDPELGIEWGLSEPPLLSAKDAAAAAFRDAVTFP